jgi:NADH:ubiquinone oxidoreductase subunit C
MLLLQPAVKSIKLLKGFGLEVFTVQTLVIPLITFFLMHTQTQYKVLTDIIIYDTLKNTFRFGLVYALLSLATGNRLFVVTKVNSYEPVVSLTSLFFVAS